MVIRKVRCGGGGKTLFQLTDHELMAQHLNARNSSGRVKFQNQFLRVRCAIYIGPPAVYRWPMLV